MVIELKGLNIGNVVNAAGGLNKTTRKISSTYNFIRDLIISIILF